MKRVQRRSWAPSSEVNGTQRGPSFTSPSCLCPVFGFTLKPLTPNANHILLFKMIRNRKVANPSISFIFCLINDLKDYSYQHCSNNHLSMSTNALFAVWLLQQQIHSGCWYADCKSSYVDFRALFEHLFVQPSSPSVPQCVCVCVQTHQYLCMCVFLPSSSLP